MVSNLKSIGDHGGVMVGDEVGLGVLLGRTQGKGGRYSKLRG